MATSILSSGSAAVQIERALLEPTIGMTRHLRRVPPEIANVFYDFTRTEPRKLHPLGCYPRLAIAFAANGAPFIDVVGPLTMLRALVWNTYYQDQLPSLECAQVAETVAQGTLDESALGERRYVQPVPNSIAAAAGGA